MDETARRKNEGNGEAVSVEELTEEVKALKEKMREERIFWMDKMKQKDREREEAVAQTIAAVRRPCDLILSKICTTYGTHRGDEWVLDMLKPKEREGYIWSIKAEPLEDEHTLRIRCKEIEIKREE